MRAWTAVLAIFLTPLLSGADKLTEPDRIELMRGLFTLSDESRGALQNFLAAAAHRGTTAAIDPEGRFILQPRTFK